MIVNDDTQIKILVRKPQKTNGHVRTRTPNREHQQAARELSESQPGAASLLQLPPILPPQPPSSAPYSTPIDEAVMARMRSIPVKIDLEEELRKSDLRHTRFMTDPLPDELYISAHAAAERKEKRSKNIERELLHHNAAKIESDLEKLRSPEWVKAIGLSQALLARLSKKELEQRKEGLVANLEATLDKYRAWSNSEKRKRRTSSSPKESQERDSEEIQTESENGAGGQGTCGEESDIEHPRKAARRGTSSKKPQPVAGQASKALKKAKSPKVEPEFTSFYNSPSMREQAVSNRRRSSRMQTAFGQPLPAMEEKEFSLPPEFIESASAARHTRARKRLSR